MEMWVLPGMQLELSYKCELGFFLSESSIIQVSGSTYHGGIANKTA